MKRYSIGLRTSMGLYWKGNVTAENVRQAVSKAIGQRMISTYAITCVVVEMGTDGRHLPGTLQYVDVIASGAERA